MNLPRRSVLAAVAAIGVAGCTGTDATPTTTQASGPEAAVRNLLAAINAGDDERIDELTLADNPDIEQQSVTVETVRVHSAERYASRTDRSATAVRERMAEYIGREGFENYAFVSVDVDMGERGPFDGYATVVKDGDRWLLTELSALTK
ncbi:hypothetical protein [Halovenus halobia]|uniref:hypothetical protein n=1 Tax=Halovenus halobia TaxID=3396622 RepID=UPI003F5772C3